MSERMKYSCNACGRWVEAGSGHSCYTPTSARTELEADTASSEMSRMHSLSVEQGKRIAELEAENQRLEAENKWLKEMHQKNIDQYRCNGTTWPQMAAAQMCDNSRVAIQEDE